MSVRPAPGPLPKDVHRHRSEYHCRRDTANNKEAVPHPLHRNPVVAVECQTEGKEVLDEIHDSEGFCGLLSVNVDYVGHDSGGSELDAQVDETETDDDRNGPRILGVKRLAPGEESNGGEHKVG